MKKRIIALTLVFLILSTQFTYAQVTGTSDPEFINREKEEIPPGEDILINVAEYQPRVVTKDKFNTDDYTGYTVYALLTGMQTNPFIDISKIRTITTRVYNTNPSGVQASYRRPAGVYSLDNMGMILIRLPKIKDERKIPDRIDVNMSAIILYDVDSGFGIGEKGLNLPQISDKEFTDNKEKYSFWSGRGYIKADIVEDNKATLTIYDGRLQKVRSGLTLAPGQESSEIFLNVGYFLPQSGESALRGNIRDRFKVKLDYIGASKDRVKLQILVNNRIISEELAEGERLYEGSSWRIKKITPSQSQDIIELENIDTRENAIITGTKEASIDCTRITTENLCKSSSECKWRKEGGCISKSVETSQPLVYNGDPNLVKVAEQETQDAINEFNKLDQNSLFINYKDVIDRFSSLFKKYPDSVYASFARTYLTKEIRNKTSPELRQEVDDYISIKLKENGLSVNLVSQQTAQVEKSEDYYRKAVEGYKEVVRNKYSPEKEQKELSLDAQRKIAELYDYYLNDVDNAILAYQDLINNFGIAEFEKILYESRIKFLKETKNYFSQPIDIYEDGNPIQIVLGGVERTENKPLAFISVNNEVAKEFREGASLDLNGNKWVLESISGNKITLVRNKPGAFNPTPRKKISVDKNKFKEGVGLKPPGLLP